MRHFKGVPTLIQIIPTQASYHPTNWGSNRHYNTSTILSYDNKIQEHINIQLHQPSKGTHSQDKTQKSNN